MSNQKKVILITGASRGLGKSIATSLGKNNRNIVYGTSRNLDNVPNCCVPLELDLSKEHTIASSINQIISKEGKIDVVVNNAGIAYYGPAEGMTSNEVRNLFEINVFGPFRLMQLILPYMRKQKRGRIFFISSIRAIESHAYMGVYSATKAALESMAFDWAVTLSKWNIQVSIVQPGPLDTGIELKQGHYFNEKNANPYFPYATFEINCQSTDEAAEKVVQKIENHSIPPLRFQTSEDARNIIAKHVVDVTGNKWFFEQCDSLTN